MANKNMDSLTPEEREELDEALGSDDGPEELSSKEQDDIKRMINGEGSKKTKKDDKGKEAKKDTLEKKKEQTAPPDKKEISKPDDIKRPKKDFSQPKPKKAEDKDKSKQPKKEKKSKKNAPWKPRPVKPKLQKDETIKAGESQESQDQSTDKKPPQPPQPPKSQGSDESGGAGDSSQLTIVGYIAIVVAIVLVFGGLMFADANNWLNTGLNSSCKIIGMEEGCISLDKSGGQPIQELSQIREVFSSTSSHSFEVKYDISLPESALIQSGNQTEAQNSETEASQESSDTGETQEEGSANDQAAMLSFSGSATGFSAPEGVQTIIELDDSSSSQLWKEFSQSPLTVNWNSGAYFKSEALKFEGWTEVMELNSLSYFDFLSLTASGVNNISRQSSGEGVTQYSLALSPENLSLEKFGTVNSLKINMWVDSQEKLPQEIDFEIDLENGSISVQKFYKSFNSVESEITDISPERQLTYKSFSNLIYGLKLTPEKRDEKRKEDLAQIQSALEAYYKDKDQYPVSSEFDQLDRTNSTVAQMLVPQYLTTIPQEYLTDRYFYGYQSEDGQNYTLTCILEREDDPDAQSVDGLNIYKLQPKE